MSDINRLFCPGFSAYFRGIVLTLLCLPIPSFAQSNLCAPGGAVSQQSSTDILRRDSVQSPWTNETPVGLRSSETIDGVLAMRADLSHWAPIAFDSNGRISAEDFDFLQFRIRSSIDNPPVNIMASSNVVCPFSKFAALDKNSWKTVQIPLSSLGLVNQQDIGRLKIKSSITGAFTMWISEVRLISSRPESDATTPVEPQASSDSSDPVQPTTQFVPWHRDPGVLGEIDDHLPSRVTRLSANGQDQLDDSASFQAALDTISGGGVLEIPAGTYYLSNTIRLSRDNQILRGAGSNRTRLVFTQSLPHGIAITGQYPQSVISVIKGDYLASRLLVERMQNVVAGTYAVLTDADNLHSQIISIVGQESDGTNTRLLLAAPLNSAFGENSHLQLFDANEYSGIEALSLDVNAGSTHIGDMIHMRSAAHAWLRDVVSRHARQSHVFTRQTYHCEITGNTLLDATGHGDGKQGYGIDLANSTTGCLVENNTLGYLRHSILFNGGANGNVVAFNHSFSPRHTNFAEGGPGDISFHGFSYANLVEGNVVERIHIGDAGPVGEGNLIHRNCLTSGPLTVDNSPGAVQNLYANAIYGSNALLQSTFMPAVLPETPEPRPYLQSGNTIFDDDGVSVSASARLPSLVNNWYRGEQFDIETDVPETYYNTRFSPLLADGVTDNWQHDCRTPAVLNAQGL